MSSKQKPGNEEIPLQDLNRASECGDAEDVMIDIPVAGTSQAQPSDNTNADSDQRRRGKVKPPTTAGTATDASTNTTGVTNLTGIAWFRKLMSSKIEKAKRYQFRIRFERYRAVRGTPFEMLSVLPSGRSPVRLIPMGTIPEESSSSGGYVIYTTQAECHEPPGNESLRPGETVSSNPDFSARTGRSTNVPTDESRQDDIIEVASIRRSSSIISGVPNPDALTCRGVYFGNPRPQQYKLDCSKAITCCECVGFRSYDDNNDDKDDKDDKDDNDDNDSNEKKKCCGKCCSLNVKPVVNFLFGTTTFNNCLVCTFLIIFIAVVMGLLMQLLVTTLHTQEVVDLALEKNSTKYRRF